MDRLILASASPQRRTLLEGLDVIFDVIPSNVHEPAHPELSPSKRAQELALLKAQEVAARHPGCWIIGCDTLVESADGDLLEKAADAEQARTMIQVQSGRTSTVHSALVLMDPAGTVYAGLSSSRVTFKKLSEKDIEWWIHTDQWRDRSGSFQIDGLGQLMIENLEGDWTSVVGLPVFLLGQLCDEAKASFFKKD
jgi:septum formation protein